MSNKTVRAGEQATSLRYRMMELAASMSNVIPLGRGDPDLDTPRHVWERALDKMTRVPSSVPVRGLPSLRAAIARRLAEEKRWDVDPAREIIITNGAQEGLFFSMMALVNPGDVVATPDPRYSSYDQAIGAAGGTLVEIPTGPDRDFQLQSDDVSAYAGDAKVLVFVNPSNPTGGFVSAEGTRALARVAQERDLIVIADEIYEDLVYDGQQILSLATCEGMRERTITLSGFSKSYAMTGFRVGYLVGDQAFIDAVECIKAAISGPCPLFSQQTALAAMEQERDTRGEFLEIYQRRRDVMMKGLNTLGIPYGHMGGGLFMWADVSRFGIGAERFCYELLKDSGVLMFPGTSFGDRWTDWVRISLLAPEDEIAQAVERMRVFVDTLRAL